MGGSMVDIAREVCLLVLFVGTGQFCNAIFYFRV